MSLDSIAEKEGLIPGSAGAEGMPKEDDVAAIDSLRTIYESMRKELAIDRFLW